MPVKAVHTALMTSIDSQWMSSLRTPQPYRPVEAATDKLESQTIRLDTPDRVLVTPEHSQTSSRLAVPESDGGVFTA